MQVFTAIYFQKCGSPKKLKKNFFERNLKKGATPRIPSADLQLSGREKRFEQGVPIPHKKSQSTSFNQYHFLKLAPRFLIVAPRNRNF